MTQAIILNGTQRRSNAAFYFREQSAQRRTFGSVTFAFSKFFLCGFAPLRST